jgi:ATP-binding cassette, subfamily B, bacterial
MRAVFGPFWSYTRGDRFRLFLGGVLIMVVTACELFSVVAFEEIVGRVLQHNRLAAFWGPAALWLGAAAVGALAMCGGGYLSALAAERFLLRLRDRVFARAQLLPADFFAGQRLGDLIIRLTDDLAVVESTVASGTVGLATSLISFLAFATAAVVISWSLALVALAVAPLFWLAARGFSARLRSAAQAERQASGSIASAVEESLANQAIVQALNRQQTESRRLHEAGTAWLRSRMRQTRLDSVYGPLVYLIETSCVLVVLGAGAWNLVHHRISLGGLLAFAACLAYLYAPVQSLSGFLLGVNEAAASAQRITEILDTEPAVTDGTAIRSRLRGRGRIEFDRVTFGYPGADRPVLRQVSFTVGPGQVLAVVGPSGCGKSTLARLLLRFYDPDAGRVLLDGVDVRELSLATLRSNLTLLQQESPLFAGTVGQNIAYGRTGATAPEIVAAARAADADQFIRALPGGYDSPVGQQGRLLSGGQRQRVGLARAILRAAPVLVLDEPTSGLDDAGAARIMALLAPAMAGRTTILITHDEHLAARADAVVRLESPPVGNLTVPSRTPATMRAREADAW